MLAPKPINAFLYPRTITIFRPNGELSTAGGAGQGQPSQPGSTGTYWGTTGKPVTDGSPGEATVLANVPCSIQAATNRITGVGQVPSDAPGPIGWSIFIPLHACPKGTIKREDVIVDDEGVRYQVSSPYWNSLGWKVGCVLLTDG